MIEEKYAVDLSPLPKTWILDLDGTIVKHNGYKTDGGDSFLPGAEDFLRAIPPCDMIVFITSRKRDAAGVTQQFLQDNNIRYDALIYDAPYGERILLNDDKPSGLRTAYAFCKPRDSAVYPAIAHT